MKTLIAYRGPSVANPEVSLDLVISGLKRPSANTKTGPMCQASIYLTDLSPYAAQKIGADVATCNDCVLRPIVARKCRSCGHENRFGAKKCRSCGGELGACYVSTIRGEGSKFKSSRALEPVDTQTAVEIMRGRKVRFGTYGNSSNIPRAVLEPILSVVRSHTLYEQQWLEPHAQWLRRWAMASVGSASDRREARSMGWRTFRRLYPGDRLGKREKLCLHVSRGLQCIDCHQCDGAKTSRHLSKPDYAIHSHR